MSGSVIKQSVSGLTGLNFRDPCTNTLGVILTD